MYDLTKNELYWQIPKTPSEIPLCATSSPDGEKLLIAYSSNKIRIFDIMNKCLHPWSRKNDELFPHNFLIRYNRLIGATSLSNTKFLFYSNYTYSILDLTKDLPVNPPEVKIIQDHPGKQIDSNSNWMECLKKSQSKYLESMPED